MRIPLLPREPRGQTLVEFALTLPILVLIVLGIMQFGLLFWAQITLTQVARDTGRWAATQPGCDSATVNVPAEANEIAGNSSLFGFGGALASVTAGWTDDTTGGGTSCPPPDNTEIWYVDIELAHTVDVFLPLVADNGCAGGCRRTLTSEVRYRMEPAP